MVRQYVSKGAVGIRVGVGGSVRVKRRQVAHWGSGPITLAVRNFFDYTSRVSFPCQPCGQVLFIAC